MPYAAAARARIYYELHGPKPGEAPAVAFAHGAGGNHLSWWQQVPHFRDRYTCLVFDHRGFGQSTDDSDAGAAAFAGDLRALLDHAGIERAHLVAQSMGGWTCLRFALAHPERVARLVMSDTHGGLASPEIDAAWRAARAAAPPLPAGAHPAAGGRMLEEQPELHFLYTEIDALNEPRTPQQLVALLGAAPRVTPEDVRALRLPVLFIAGEEDAVIPPPVLEAAARYFPDARLERVPRAGHSVYFERAAAYNTLIERFLEG